MAEKRKPKTVEEDRARLQPYQSYKLPNVNAVPMGGVERVASLFNMLPSDVIAALFGQRGDIELRDPMFMESMSKRPLYKDSEVSPELVKNRDFYRRDKQ